MHALKTVFAELLGLFADDAVFALAIALWLAFVAFALPRLDFARTWGGAILFAGLAAILVTSAVRRAHE